MIYDCFPFFNELEILELRLNELSESVDKFVLVEATRTFQKEPKPLYYLENRSMFRKFEEKIIHVVVDKYPSFFSKFRTPTPWDYDNHQKDQVARALHDCKPDDVIIVSDVDEIPRADKIREYAHVPGVKVFQQRLSNFYFNCVALEGPDESHLTKVGPYLYWRGSVMVDFRDFTTFRKTRKMRSKKGQNIVQVEDGGWHFSFLGNWERVQYKLRSWAHTKEEKYSPEYLNDPKTLQALIEGGEDLFGRDYRYGFIPLDDSFPRFLLDNRDRFAELVKN